LSTVTPGKKLRHDFHVFRISVDERRLAVRIPVFGFKTCRKSEPPDVGCYDEQKYLAASQPEKVKSTSVLHDADLKIEPHEITAGRRAVKRSLRGKPVV